MNKGVVVITGGGTGGHIFPMTAIADALTSQGISVDDLVFVGSRRGQEGTLLSGRRERVVLLPGRGFRRSLTPSALVANVGAVARIIWSQLHALLLTARWRPSVVISVGGYAAFPMACAAAVLRRTLVVVELDATPGLVHRVLGRFATVICQALEPLQPRGVLTGAPLRSSILSVDRSADGRSAARRELAIDENRLLVVVMTGSLGARSVNRAVVELVADWRPTVPVSILHVTGRRNYEDVVAQVAPNSSLEYRAVPFAEKMETLWAAADVAVCRAGATTVAELTALGVPAVLVPLPNAPGDHQTKNARAVAQVGGAIVVPDNECNGDRLRDVLDPLLLNADTRLAMGTAAGTLGRRDAAQQIAKEVRKVMVVS